MSGKSNQGHTEFEAFKAEVAQEVLKLDNEIKRQKTVIDQKNMEIGQLKREVERLRGI